MKNESINKVYQIVTDKFIEALEQGTIIWQKPWASNEMGVGYVSHANGKPYSMLNTFLLMMQGGAEGEYLTMKQVNDEGGTVKKGAKRKMVVFSNVSVKMFEEQDEEGNTVTRERTYHVFKYYHVFHVSECEGVKVKYPVTAETKNENVKELNPIQEAENVIDAYVQREGITFQNMAVTDRAYYSPSQDLVNVPCLSQYDIAEEYYSTTFHELTHSTGIAKRCNRGLEKGVAFGDNDYSKEELVAEIGSAMCINRLGINNEKAFKNSVAYVQGWLKALRNDNRLIVWAAGRAEKAVNYIFTGNQYEQDTED